MSTMTNVGNGADHRDLVNALTVIRELFTQGKVDESRRMLLKDLVIQRNDALLGALELYANSFDLDDLLDSINVLLHQYANVQLPPPLPTSTPSTFSFAPTAAAAAVQPEQQTFTAPTIQKSIGNQIPTFKLVIAGDGAVGKSTFTRRVLGKSFDKTYIATLGVEVHRLLLKTSLGEIIFNLWDLAGLEKFGGLRDGYYIGAQAALIMFSVTDRASYKNVPNWHRDVIRVADVVPMVLCGTKRDLKYERKINPKMILFHRKKNLQYVELSSATQSREQLLRPFLRLVRLLAGDSTIELLDDNGQKIVFDGSDSTDESKIEREPESEDDDDNDKEQPAEESAKLFCADFASAENPLFAPAPMAAPSAFESFSFNEVRAPIAAPSAFEF
jgi:GTP-binding nuclear protein Ran